MYLNIYKYLAFIVFAIVVFALISTILSVTRKHKLITIGTSIIVFILIWGTVSMLFSWIGFFDLNLQIAGLFNMVYTMLIPLIAFLVFSKNRSVFKLLDKIKNRYLIRFQTYRILGSLFLFMAWFNDLPSVFAIPPGILDITIGTTGLILSFNPKWIHKFGKLWNYLGLFDFALAFGIYFLYHPFNFLEASNTQIAFTGQYPITHIITFFVPLAVMLHILSLRKIKNKQL